MADFEPGPVGELTGLPLSKFATAELVARAHQAGYVNLWDYVEALEDAISEEGIWHHVIRDG